LPRNDPRETDEESLFPRNQRLRLPVDLDYLKTWEIPKMSNQNQNPGQQNQNPGQKPGQQQQGGGQKPGQQQQDPNRPAQNPNQDR
jgi:hypothetical protein